jgi:hypothetical protein
MGALVFILEQKYTPEQHACLTSAPLRLYHRCHDRGSNFEFVESAVVPELLAIALRMEDHEKVFAWGSAPCKVFGSSGLCSA